MESVRLQIIRYLVVPLLSDSGMDRLDGGITETR